MISREKLIELLEERSPARVRALLDTADRTRAYAVGESVHLRALIEISNVCRRNCLYCGLRAANRHLPRYRMADREIVEAVLSAAARGRRTVVLQSGEDSALTAPRVARMIRRIKDAADVAVTLSLGEYPRDDYFQMREAGADRYLLKHETVDPDLYKSLHPGMSFERRIRCLVWLKEAGFQAGSGMMVGLPGQSAATLADDIIFLRRLDADMAGIGPFIPHPHTPLKHSSPGGADLCLKAVALTRLALPFAHIPATTALATLCPNGTERALKAGADVIMPLATPEKYRRLYEIYPDRSPSSDSGPDSVIELVRRLGRTVSRDYGHTAPRLNLLAPFDISAYKRALQRCPL
jgi:biotin synthase